MQTIDLDKMKRAVMDSRKAGRADNYLGEVLNFLAGQKVRKMPILTTNDSLVYDIERDDEIQDVLMISILRIKRLFKEKKLIAKGKAPKQLLQYLRNLINFSYMENRSFILKNSGKRVTKHTQITVVEIPANFDIMDDYNWNLDSDEIEYNFNN